MTCMSYISLGFMQEEANTEEAGNPVIGESYKNRDTRNVIEVAVVLPYI